MFTSVCLTFVFESIHFWSMNGLRVGNKVWRNLEKGKSNASMADENLNVVCSSYFSFSHLCLWCLCSLPLAVPPFFFFWLNFPTFSLVLEKTVFPVNISQSPWNLINHLGKIKFVFCTGLHTVWTSRLFAVNLKVFWETCWFGFFWCKFAQSDKGGLFLHQCFFLRFYFLWLVCLWEFTYVYVQKHHALHIQVVFLKIH